MIFIISLLVSLFFGWGLTKILVNLSIGFFDFFLILIIVNFVAGYTADYLGIFNITALLIGSVVATIVTAIYEALKID